MNPIHRRGVRVPLTASEAEAAEVALDILRHGAQTIGAKFTDPDDDWLPTWAVITPDHGTIIGTGQHEANDQRAKAAVTRHVASFARRVGAVAIGSLMSTWVVELDVKGDPERARQIQRQVEAAGGSLENIAERVERLIIFVYTAGSFTTYWATIDRHENAPPMLGEFKAELRSSDEGASLTGRMTEPLQDALRRFG